MAVMMLAALTELQLQVISLVGAFFIYNIVNFLGAGLLLKRTAGRCESCRRGWDRF